MPAPIYLDASALVKLIAPEAETEALDRFLAPVETLVTSSVVCAVEVGRAARRLDREAEAAVTLSRVVQLDLTPEVVSAAVAVDPVGLRTLDAIHVASAQTLDDAPLFVTYDARLADAARAAGLDVRSPS